MTAGQVRRGCLNFTNSAVGFLFCTRNHASFSKIGF